MVKKTQNNRDLFNNTMLVLPLSDLTGGMVGFRQSQVNTGETGLRGKHPRIDLTTA
jgi:hypothetical protein